MRKWYYFFDFESVDSNFSTIKSLLVEQFSEMKMEAASFSKGRHNFFIYDDSIRFDKGIHFSTPFNLSLIHI